MQKLMYYDPAMTVTMKEIVRELGLPARTNGPN